ncbi:DUF4428 domain-containing protein [Candidatus Enterococcus ferrettii]|uniref:DUF4428 domain-containing protein n=1 Tax=Candidatus Enterococcus ferrettii TaxID=2815324 RepID=A0ABV0ELQ9_9ENTE|nr:DUF4428 domain-containing protein [Enterococcus sp. 665A]MBO1338161.1 DUF4428 domain-containing protein [Enterococcus sp. 665A]
MKECLICKTSLRFIKFKCADGYVCKNCYEKASQNFSQTIKNRTKEELLKQFDTAIEVKEEAAFEISRKINQLLLFDDKNQQFCLPNHKKYTKEDLKPEIYPFSAIINCQMMEEQIEKVVKKKKQTLGCIKVVLTLDQGEKVTRAIWLIPNFINTTSMPYQTMKSLAENVVNEINQSREGILC